MILTIAAMFQILGMYLVMAGNILPAGVYAHNSVNLTIGLTCIVYAYCLNLQNQIDKLKKRDLGK